MKSPEVDKFEKLVRDNQATIYSVCYMYSNDDDEVADLFQECLINIWKALPGFRNGSKIGTWIYRICLNTCISADRKKKSRHTTVSLDISHDVVAQDSPNGRQMKVLHDRISTLPPIDRAIVLLWLENIPYDEIADIIGVSSQYIGVRLYRIKEQLKAHKK